MKASKCRPTDEIFTHIHDSGLVRHFNASEVARSMPRLLKEGAAILAEVEIEQAFVSFIKERRGVEQWKIERMQEPYLSKPLIGVYMPDGTVLTIDGHHRMVVLESLGRKTYLIYLLAFGTWGGFLVEDMPESVDLYCVTEAEKQLHGA